MAAFLDGCRFNPAAGGTTDWTYSSAVPGYQSPAAASVVNGRLYKYRAESSDLSQWELGEGAYNTGTGVLARTTVLFNSSGTTSKINFTATPQVAIVALKEDLLSVEEANSFSATQQAQARVNLEAAPFDALASNNIIINGGMEIDQQNVGALTTFVSTAFAADMWVVSQNGTMACSFQQVSDAPPGFSNSLRITVGTAEATLGGGDYAIVQQRIEGYRASKLGYGVAGAQSATLGFWTKIHRTGTYSGSMRNVAGNRSYPFTFTQNVADTWEYKTVTIPGDTTGTWAGNTNSTSHQVFFAVAAGTTMVGTANTWTAQNYLGATGTTNGVAGTSDVFQITGVSLVPGTEVGSVARSPLLKRSFDQELLLCMRYYEKSYDYATAPQAVTHVGMVNLGWSAGGATNEGNGFNFKTIKRAAPTMAYWDGAGNANAGSWYTVGAWGEPHGAVATIQSSQSGVIASVNLGAAHNLFCHYTADARL